MNLGKIYSGLFFLLFAIFLFIVAGWVYGLIATGIVLAILAIVFFLWRNGYNEKPAIIVSRIAILASILLILASIVMILDTYINGTRHYDYSIRTCGYCDGTGCKFCDGWGGHLIEDKHYTATEIGSNGFLLFFESAMLLCGMIFGLKDTGDSFFAILEPINDDKKNLFKKLFIIGFTLVFIIGFIDIFASTNGFQTVYRGMLQAIAGNEAYTSAFSAAFLWLLASLLSGVCLGGVGS